VSQEGRSCDPLGGWGNEIKRQELWQRRTRGFVGAQNAKKIRFTFHVLRNNNDSDAIESKSSGRNNK
jgi:hypothetical protein